jgi:hypothetical protein
LGLGFLSIPENSVENQLKSAKINPCFPFFHRSSMHFASRFQVQRILDEAEEKFLGIEGSDLDRRRCEKIGSQWIYLVNSPIFSGKTSDQW